MIITLASALGLLVVYKLIRFTQKGGTFTLITKNVSYLYFQGRLVYPKLYEDAVRYIALLINSASNRSHFPKDRIKQLVLSCSNEDWFILCAEYTWEYSMSCGGPSPDSLPHELVTWYFGKIRQTISWVENQVRCGKTRKNYENVLRGMSQMEVIEIVLELEKF
jgi:hypothetical protein